MSIEIAHYHYLIGRYAVLYLQSHYRFVQRVQYIAIAYVSIVYTTWAIVAAHGRYVYRRYNY